MVDRPDQGDRGFIDWKPYAPSRQTVEDILSVLDFYRRGGYPAPTVRDVYYDLLGRYGASHGYVKGEKLKRNVYRLIGKMRRSKMIRFSQINDDSPESLMVVTHDDPADFWSSISDQAHRYRKNLSANQPKRVIVFTEGAGAVRQFAQVAKDYTIPVYSGGGWDSLSLKHDTAEEAVFEHRHTGRPTVVLHAGDFDPDGVFLFRCFTEDVAAFAASLGDASVEDVITFKRVMLRPEQVPDYGKTPIDRKTVKKMNHRGQQWPHDFKAELQAMRLEERLRLMRQAIEREVDQWST